MLDYGDIRSFYKNIDKVNSQYQIIAEWNMNKYIQINQYGIYKGAGDTTTYTSNDANIVSGQNYLVYDDGTKEVNPSQEYYSQLASVFRPNRPDPGIVLLQYFPNMTFAPKAGDTKVASMKTDKARYYFMSENRSYDYFNSAKLVDIIEDINSSNIVKNGRYGVSNGEGKIENANPFVVYSASFACNKITIKLQNHLCRPDDFTIDILPKDSNTWTPAYSSNNENDFSTGILNIYLNNGVWSKTVSRVDNFDELTSITPTQLVQIRGIRLRVRNLTKVKGINSDSPGSLELIELSPRLEVDLSEYTESFNMSTSIGDSTNFGMPVGSIVSGTGGLNLSNEDNQFLMTSTLSSLNMLNQDVKFSFYQKVYLSDQSPPTTYTVPLKVLYSTQWNVGQDYSVSVNLEDGFKYLRETAAPDLLFSSNAAMSAIILILLDNVGITGLEFKKSSDATGNNKEDTRIKNFFCKKEQTVAEVLEQIAIATQCSIFYDAAGRLNVLTKERLSENADIAPSTGPADLTLKTDFWFVGDENYIPADAEYSQVQNYRANIISIQEEKINPITDGEITYHTYGPRKTALANSLQDDQGKIIEQFKLDQVPVAALAFSDYGYATTILWDADTKDNSATLGAANVIFDIPKERPKEAFSSVEIDAIDENDFVRKLYVNSLNTNEKKRKVILYLDSNEGLTISPFEGMVLVDSEYIRYRGKLYFISSANPTNSGYRIIFTEEEYWQMQANIQKGESIFFKGLVIDLKTQVGKTKANGLAPYKIIDDGRGALKSIVRAHSAFAENSDGIEENKRFRLMLGGTKIESNNLGGQLKATTKFNFLDKVRFRSAKRKINTLPPDYLQSYLGFLHISGPSSPTSETDIFLSIIDKNKSQDALSRLNKINEQVDEAVPGNFDDFVYMQGERNIYGQKISLPFTPNVISTRMRLYSPRRTVKKYEEYQSTNSAIAGIGFGINSNNEGYYLEIESVGSGKNFAEQNKAYLRNLRLYKVTLEQQKKGGTVYEPKLLLDAPVGAFLTYDTSLEIINSVDGGTDPVVDLEIFIRKFRNGGDKYRDAVEYSIYYGGQKVGSYIESDKWIDNLNSKDIFLFVRNDSQAIYENVMAAARPYNYLTTKNKDNWFRNYRAFKKQIKKGAISTDKNFLFKNEENGILFYYNDFARLARQVKEYEVRFTAPAYVSALIDVSDVNPKYFVKKYQPTAFGAKITVVNSSSGATNLGEGSNSPLFVVGVAAQELHTGVISMKNIEDMTQDDKKRTTNREFNAAIYGYQSFNLDSQYIQSLTHASNLMRWVTKYCSKPRIKLTMEIFANPLLELGDKVKVFDKSRGYTINQFGNRTFTVSSITHTVSSSGPTMTISLIEVGEAT